MQQPHSPNVVAARLDELLMTIDQSAVELKRYLIKQAQSSPLKTNGKHVKLEDTSSRSLYPFYGDASAASHAFLIKMACERLITLVTPPHLSIMEQSSSYFTSVAIKVCVDHDVSQHIYNLSSGDQGASLEEVAEMAMLDPKLLGRILRYLSQKGTFQPDGPTRFKNTTASLTLSNDPEFKSFINLITTEVQNGSSKLGAYMEEQYHASKSPEYRNYGSEPLPSPFNMYTGLPLYQWLHQPENAVRSQIFNQGMRGLARAESFSSIPLDYDFNSLPVNTTLVDVGGGIGALAEMILPASLNLKMIVQDLEPVIHSASENPSQIIKSLMDAGRLRFEAQDFFKDQKGEMRGNAFLVCNVLLNQSDDNSLQILKRIRKSDPSKLIIVDRFYGPFFPVEANSPDGERDIYDAIRKASQTHQETTGRPGPQSLTAVYDMIMASMFVTKTRTHEQWLELLADAGYVLVKVTPIRASSGHVVIEARPCDS